MKTAHGREWTASVNGTGLRVEQVGAAGRVVVFSPSLWLTRRMFDAPVATVRDDYRCITYDHRGQGDSGFGAPGVPRRALAVEGLYDDAVALLDQLNVGPCHWVGSSVGAFVGMRVAARRPDLIRSLVLLSPRMSANGHAAVLQVDLLCLAIRASHRFGRLDAVVRRGVTHAVMRALFGATFLSDPARADDRETYRRLINAQLVPEALPMVRAVLGFPECPPELLRRIEAPTLVMAGEEDTLGVGYAREVQQAIRGARLVTVPGAGHILVVEQPRVVCAAIAEQLRTVDLP